MLLLIWCSSAKEAAVDKIVDNEDHIQNGILDAMKDSGVLKEWNDKLNKIDSMLNDVEINEKQELNNVKSMLSEEELVMLRNFIEEYASEQNLKILSPDVIIKIIKKVHKTRKPNLPQLFVQLGPLIEVVSALSRKTTNIEKIIDRQGPVFNSPAKTKDVFHTLTENLRSELVRLTLDVDPSSTKTDTPSKPKLPKKKMGLKEILVDYFKVGDADKLFTNLQKTGLANIFPDLLSSGNYVDLFFSIIDAYFEGSPYGPLIKQYGQQFLASEQGKILLAGVNNVLINVAGSESGQRFIKLMPQFLATRDLQSFLEILGEEAEWNWRLFFDNIENEDYKDAFLETLAGYLTQGYELLLNPPKDSTLSQIPLMINGFLISYRIPAFDSSSPIKSITAIINKCIRLFTTYKFDSKPYVQQVQEALSKSLQKYLEDKNFNVLTEQERKSIIVSLLNDEFVSPIQKVWEVYLQAASQPECSEQFLCLLNMKEKKSKQGQTRQAVVNGASLAASWSLSRASQEVYMSLHNAVMAGSKGADCMASYPSSKNKCKLIERKKSLKSKHTEL